MKERALLAVGRAALITALFAFGVARSAPGAPPSAAATPPPRPLGIDKNSVLILIRTTLVALQQANQSNNYTILYAISAPGFQSLNSPERLSEIFAGLRAKNFDLSGVVVLEPQLTVLPEIYSNGVMRMAGLFPSVPMQVSFDLQFISVQKQWRLLAIAVDIGSSTPVAPVPPAESFPRAAPVPQASASPKSVSKPQ